jgi:translocation and assembly module TamB
LPVRFSLEPFAFAVPDDAPLAGSIVGAVDLARAANIAALDGQAVTGTLASDLRLSGTLAQPALAGDLTVRGGRLDDVTTGASFRDIGLTARAEGRSVEIAELTATDRYGGRIAGKGTVGLDASLRPQMDVALNLARARVLDGDYGAAVLSGDASLKGDGDSAQLEARLTVNDADIHIPDRAGGPSIPELDIAVKGAPPPKAPAARTVAYPIGLDVRVDAPARLFVRGRGLDSEWGGSVQAKGTLQEPDVRGQLRFRRGFLDLLDRRFAIREGVVAFDGSRPPIPQVSLEAAATAEEVQAVVRLRGPATDPKLELTSEPPLPQDEVLARVLFGRSTDRITPVQGIRLAAAVRELQGGRGGVNGVLDAIRNATGLDTLSVESGATAGESAASAGKYINDRVYLQVQRGIQAGSGKARVEVELTPNLSVGTSVTEQSQTGVDLQWRYDY